MADDNRVEHRKRLNELKSPERLDLCKILNQNDKWEDLADLMEEISGSTIRALKSQQNPTEELLVKWSHYNHTIEDLFLLLSKIQHYQSMTLLKPFVNEKHHHLINDGQANIQRLYRLKIKNSGPKDLKIAPQNFNDNHQPSQSNNQKVFDKLTDKELGAEKIINVSSQPSMVMVPSKTDNILRSPDRPLHNNFPVSQPVPGTSKINNEQKIPLADSFLPEIAYEELTRATDNWSSYNILGEGSLGTVFHGKWKQTGVAVRKIEQPGPAAFKNYLIQLQQSSRGLRLLNSCRHENILWLKGFSMGPETSCLVYELMIKNGSLKDFLFSKVRNKRLTWLQRHEIAKGTARGLQFLHTLGDKPIIHGDIKSANILLDKNYNPKIEGFRIARRGPGKDCKTEVNRMLGLRPDFPVELLKNENISTKIDTYKFGIVLFELATGLPAYDDARPGKKYLKELIDNFKQELIHFMKDKHAGTDNSQVFENLITLGKWCTKILVEDRPEMVEVFHKINEL